MKLNDANTIVVKVGSSLLADKNRNLRKKWISSFAEDISSLAKSGKNVIIVSSGAVAIGRKVISKNRQKLKIEEKQAAAAVGQPMLLREYHRAFADHKYKCAQILLTIFDIQNRRRYLNAKNTIEKLMEYGIIPIVNENDSVATQELRFGDNDRISALVAQMLHADLLVILSDVEGLYSDDPNKNPDAELITHVTDISRVKDSAKGATSKVGSGGMITKIQAAEIADNAGCSTIIARGLGQNPLRKILEGGKHTLFESTDDPISARKKWILNSPVSRGVIFIDDGAVNALKDKNSLLPVGITDTKGRYSRGDVVVIKDKNGKEVARGLTAFSNVDVRKIKGQHSSEIERILGFAGRDAVIQIDDMVLL